MYSITSRFTNNSNRMLTPMEKLEECVGLVLDHRLGAAEYKQALEQIQECVENACAQLDEVQFPPEYDAGPVLWEYAHAALVSFAAAVDSLQALPQSGDREVATQSLGQAREAYEALSELVKEVQVERYNY